MCSPGRAKLNALRCQKCIYDHLCFHGRLQGFESLLFRRWPLVALSQVALSLKLEFDSTVPDTSCHITSYTRSLHCQKGRTSIPGCHTGFVQLYWIAIENSSGLADAGIGLRNDMFWSALTSKTLAKLSTAVKNLQSLRIAKRKASARCPKHSETCRPRHYGVRSCRPRHCGLRCPRHSETCRPRHCGLRCPRHSETSHPTHAETCRPTHSAAKAAALPMLHVQEQSFLKGDASLLSSY